MDSPHHWFSWAQNNLVSLAQAAHYLNWACQLGSPEMHRISVTLLVMLSLPHWVSGRSGKSFWKKEENTWKQNGGPKQILIQIPVSVCACARKWGRKRRALYGRIWSRCDCSVTEKYRFSSRRWTLCRRRFGSPWNRSGPEHRKLSKIKVRDRMDFFISWWNSRVCECFLGSSAKVRVFELELGSYQVSFTFEEQKC